MIILAVELDKGDAKIGADFAHRVLTGPKHLLIKRTPAILGHEHQMRVTVPYSVTTSPNIRFYSHDTKHIIRYP